MFNFLKKINKQKGSSLIELTAVLTTATVVIGGVTFNVDDVLDMATDAQKVANVRQITSVLEMYYYENDFSFPDSRGGEDLFSQLDDYLGSRPANEEEYEYRKYNNGQNYVIKVKLEDEEHPALETDFKGQIEGLDCQKPAYCIKM